MASDTVKARSGRPRGRPKSLDREKVIEAAMLTYWQGDPGTLSLNEVARLLGTSKPALYREFGGEDGLIAAVLDRYRDEVVTPTLATLVSERPFLDALRDLLVSMTTPRDTPAGCLFTKMRLVPWRLSASSTSRVQAIRDEMRSAFEDWYRRALARGGEVDPNLPPERAATFIDAQLMIVLIQCDMGDAPEAVRMRAAIAFRGLLAH